MHVEVVRAVPPQKPEAYGIGRKREAADYADDLGYGRDRVEELVERLSQDNEAEPCHYKPLEHGGDRLPACPLCQDIEGEAVNESVPEHVEGVGERGGGGGAE